MKFKSSWKIGLLTSSVVILFNGCGFKSPIQLPLPDGVKLITVDVIHYDSSKFNEKQMKEFVVKYPTLSCMSNKDFDIIGKELIERRTKVEILRDIIKNNNKEAEGWF